MALDKQVKSIPFAEGPDTQTDPKLSAKPALVLNSVFEDGTLSKRPGRDLLPSAIVSPYVAGMMLPSLVTWAGPTELTSGESLTAFGQELFRINDGTAYGLSEQPEGWVPKPGGNNYSSVTSRSRVQMPAGTGAFDLAIVGDVGVIAWTMSGMHLAVYDVATGVFYQTGISAIGSSSATSRSPRLVVLGTKVLALWADFTNSKLYSAVIDTQAPTQAPTQALIRSDVSSSAVTFDAITYNNSLSICAYPSSGTALTLLGVDASGAVTTSPALTVISGAAGASGLVAGVLIQRDATGNIYVVYADRSNESTRYLIRDATFAAITSGTLVSQGNWSGGNAAVLTGASIELAANQITLVLAEVSGDGNITKFLGTAVLGPTGVMTAFSVLPATAGLNITSDLVAYDGTAVFGCVNADGPLSTSIAGIQSSAWVVNVSGQVVAKALTYETQAFPLSSSRIRVARSYASGPLVKMLFFQQGRLAYSSNPTGQTNDKIVEVTPLSIAEVDVAQTSTGTLPLLRLGESLYIGGAYPRIYDGRSLGETGFSLYPDIVSAVDAGAGNLSAGSYQWRFCYSWTLANGELIRGPVSPAQSLTLADAHSATLSIGTMPLAMRDIQIGGGNSLIEVYRTEANGTVFYRQSSVLSGPQNVTAIASAVVTTDNTSDASLVLGEILYTTGGVLDWEAPAAYSSACIHKNRLVTLPSEDPYSWAPSSEWRPGETVRFSSLTINRVPSGAGPLTGNASLDGKLILFTEGGAFVVIGDGPDLLGANNYPPPERIASVDAGPLPGTPIVQTPAGLMYQNPAGIQLLDRGLNVQFLGSDVQAFSTGPWKVRAASLDPARLQVRFLVDAGSDLTGMQSGSLVPSVGGVALVYDYFYSQWSIWPNYGGQAATFYQDRYTMVRSDGAVWQEAPGTFRDAGAYYSSVVETSWIKVAGLQGFQRLWYATVLGTYGSDFTFQWEIAYDYDGTSPTEPIWSETVTLNGADVFAQGGPFKARHHLGHKCEAIKFRFTDLSIQGSGAGMALTDLSFEYGVKKGVFRLPAGKTA